MKVWRVSVHLSRDGSLWDTYVGLATSVEAAISKAIRRARQSVPRTKFYAGSVDLVFDELEF